MHYSYGYPLSGKRVLFSYFVLAKFLFLFLLFISVKIVFVCKTMGKQARVGEPSVTEAGPYLELK